MACRFESGHRHQLRNAPFGTSPRLAARSLSRTGRFFASASRPRCWVVMQGYEVRTCSAAPRFKTVTASLGHSFVPPTWKLIHRVHMTRKTSFCPLGQKLVFSSEACLRHGKRRFAPGRCFAGKYLRKCVARFPSHCAKRDPSRRLCRPFTSCEARSFTAAPLPLHIAPARSFTLRSAQTFMKKQSVPVTAGPDAAYRFRNPRRRSRPADSVWYMGRIQNA